MERRLGELGAAGGAEEVAGIDGDRRGTTAGGGALARPDRKEQRRSAARVGMSGWRRAQEREVEAGEPADGCWGWRGAGTGEEEDVEEDGESGQVRCGEEKKEEKKRGKRKEEGRERERGKKRGGKKKRKKWSRDPIARWKGTIAKREKKERGAARKQGVGKEKARGKP